MLCYTTSRKNFTVSTNKLNMKTYLKNNIYLFLIFFSFFSNYTFALDLLDFSNEIPFEIVLLEERDKTRKLLAEVIEEAIELQRKENLTLKKYSDPVKISRFELDVIRRVLKSQGYYRYFVSAQLIKTKKGKLLKDHSLVESIIYEVNPGTQYKISDIRFELDNLIELDNLPLLASKKNEALIAESVLTTQKQLYEYVRDQYCYFNIKIDYQAVIDHQKSLATLVFKMLPSQEVTFGNVEIQGVKTIDVNYLNTFIKYKEGECFKRHQIDSTKLALLRSNLIANVSVEVSNINNAQVTTRFIVNERNHRTVPRVSNRLAGADDGVAVHRRRHQRAGRKDFRKPLYACAGTDPHGGRH